MSTSSVLRASLRRAGSSSCRRYSSTNAAVSSSVKTTADTVSLPAAKMRALVTLYQQSGDYITPENLDEAIDAAFIHNPSANFTSLNPEESYFALMDRLHERQILPRVGEANSVSPVSSNRSSETWSEYRSNREMEVIKTLYGVIGKGRPGWDVLQDEKERVKHHLEMDKASS